MYKPHNFVITTDQSSLDLEMIHDYLSNHSYWAKDVPFEVIKRSIANSINFGLFNKNKQIGFARVITDKATFAYLADVFILSDFRGHGLSKRLMQAIMDHPDLHNLRRWTLATSNAHGLYEKYGFKPLAKPEIFMEKHDPDVYRGR